MSLKGVRSQTGVSQRTRGFTHRFDLAMKVRLVLILSHTVPDGYNHLLERLAVHLVASEPSQRNEVARLTEIYALLQVICLLQRHEQTETDHLEIRVITRRK